MNHIRKQVCTGSAALTTAVQEQSCFFVRRLVTNSASCSRSNLKPKVHIHKQRQNVKRSKAVSILQDPGIPVLGKLSRQELVKLIATSVVYQEYPLIAINKPPGLSISAPWQGYESAKDVNGVKYGAVHFGRKDRKAQYLNYFMLVLRSGLSFPGGDLCLISMLPDLQQQLQLSEELHVVKASHRDYSGLVLLSTCHHSTKHIEDALIQARRKKETFASYCAVTVGIPEPTEGEIRVALKQQNIGELKLVVPVFHPTPGNFKRKEAKKAITQYRVLDAANGCALVQLLPHTTFESMLQVHLSVKLCTVLGDHVYSARLGKVLGVPFCLPVESVIPQTQVLDKSLLQKLHLDQNQMWKIPIHLHLQKLTIPPFGTKKSETVITAAPLAYFSRTLELLGLTMNEFVEDSTRKSRK